MKIQSMHDNFILPRRSSELAGGYDLFMPEWGSILPTDATKVGLGFCAAVPEGHVALLLPRSGVGAKHGVELNNTCGVIDADYRGEWFAFLRTKGNHVFGWDADDRVLQMLLVPVATPFLEEVASLDSTQRGTGGLGSTGT